MSGCVIYRVNVLCDLSWPVNLVQVSYIFDGEPNISLTDRHAQGSESMVFIVLVGAKLVRDCRHIYHGHALEPLIRSTLHLPLVNGNVKRVG